MRTGEPRLGLRSVVVALLAVGGLAWWWAHRRAPGPTTSAITQVQYAGSAAPARTAAVATAAAARLSIAVTDDQGPLAGATVRLAPRTGELVVIKTGLDGIARADDLAPGAWRVSVSAAEHLPAALPLVQLSAGADEQRAVKLVTGGRILRGTVFDATGGHIAGARIDAAQLTTAIAPRDDVSTTFTDSDGSYRLTVAEGAVMVAAASPDYAPQARVVEIGPSGAVADFALVPGGVIEGVVRDERTRQPIAGADVTAQRDRAPTMLGEAGARATTSQADGRFRLTGLRPGAWELGARAATRHARSPTIVGLGVAEQVTDVEILVGEAPVIRGRVVDDGGAPAPGVAVSALTRGDRGEAIADATGAFVMEGMSPGSYVLAARSEIYLPASNPRVTLADKDVDVVITVRRGTALAGRVEPRQACDVRAESAGFTPATRVAPISTTTGADGAFAFTALATGETTLTARCASGAEGSLRVEISPGVADVVLKVAPGGSIAGRIVDSAGKPVSAVSAMASSVTGNQRTVIVNGMITSGVQALTAADGRYEIVGLPPGAYRVTALDRGKPLRLRADPPSVELAAGEHKTGVDLAVDRPDGVIQGTITGPDGKPLPDAWVTAQQDLASLLDSLPGRAGPGGREASRSMTVEASMDGSASDTGVPPALSDARGHYELRGLPHAKYTVIAEAQRGQLRARATDVRPDATVDLQVVGVTSLAGSVTGPRGAVAMFSVELDGPTRAQRSFTDGRYAFGRVEPGTYTVRVQSSDGNAEGKVTVTANQPTTLDLVLAANAIVVGTLVDASGAPAANQPVTLVPDTGGPGLSVRIEGEPPTTGADGKFRIEHRAEPSALFVMRPGRPFTKRNLALEAGKTLDLGVIQLPPTNLVPGPGSGAPSP